MAGKWGKAENRGWGKMKDKEGLFEDRLNQRLCTDKYYTYPFYPIKLFHSQLRRIYSEATMRVKIWNGDYLVYACRRSSRLLALWEKMVGPKMAYCNRLRELIEVHSILPPHLSTFNGAEANPKLEEAMKGYSHFHGSAPDKISTDSYDWPPPLELEDEFGPFDPQAPIDLIGLGELLGLGYEPVDSEPLEREVIKFKRPYPLLASDYINYEEGEEELFVVGGHYKEKPEEDYVCGNLRWVTYLTVKSFDDMKPIEYTHEFNEPYPQLCTNKKGTQYYIFRGDSEFSIGRGHPVSAGIEG
jgi:hypothetical protein